MRDDVVFREAQRDGDIRKYAYICMARPASLLTQFGNIDILWLDFSHSGFDWAGPRARARDTGSQRKLMAMVRVSSFNIL